MRVAQSFLFIFCMTAYSHAMLTLTSVTPVDNTAGGSALDSFVTQDITIDFMGEYTGSQMLLTISSGTSPRIYQDLEGGAIPPNSGLSSSSVPFDTFVANGASTQDTVSNPNTFGDPSLAGGAVNLGGESDATFSFDNIDQAWFDPNPQATDETGFLVARLSLKNDVNGIIQYQGSADGVITKYSGTITNGVVSSLTVVPEPSSFLFLGAAMAGCFCLGSIAKAWRSWAK